MYDSISGRFLGRDPIGYADHNNLFVYTGNRAVSFVDPTGACALVCGQPKFKGQRNHKVTKDFSRVPERNRVSALEKYMENLFTTRFGATQIGGSVSTTNLRGLDGVSGFAWGVSGFPTWKDPPGCCDFSSVTVSVVSYYVVFQESGPTRIKLPSGVLIDGPKSIEEHEQWHLDGPPDSFYQSVKNAGGNLKKKKGINQALQDQSKQALKCLKGEGKAGSASNPTDAASCNDVLNDCFLKAFDTGDNGNGHPLLSHGAFHGDAHIGYYDANRNDPDDLWEYQ